MTSELTSLIRVVTLNACKIYFWAHVVHLLSCTMAIPWVRTISFAVGWGCQVALILQLL